MESDLFYYRRRLAQELTAARCALTPAGQARRLQLAARYCSKLREMGQDIALPELAGFTAEPLREVA